MAQPAADPGAPGHELDPGIGIADLEQLVMGGMEVRDQAFDVLRTAEPRHPQRHLDLPDLVRVARLDGILDRLLERAGAGAVDERLALAPELGEDRVDRLAGEALARGEAHRRELGAEVGHQGAGRAQRRADLGDHDLGAAEPARDRDRVEAGSTAAADQHGALRVDALVDRDLLDRAHHLLGGEREHGGGGLLEAEAEPACDVGLKRQARRLEVEPHRAAEEEGRVDPAEQQRAVGHRRRAAAGAVAGRPRRRARALRADVEQAARVDPGDRAAAGADALDVDRGKARHVAAEALAEPGLARPGDAALAHEADVVAGAAGIGDHRGVAAGILQRVVAPGDRRHRRPRADRVDRRQRPRRRRP